MRFRQGLLSCLTVVLVIVLVATPRGYGGRDDIIKGGVWKVKIDLTLDGKLKGDIQEPGPWKITVQGNRISGIVTDSKTKEEQRFEGTIAYGRAPVVRLRQYITGNNQWERQYVGQYRGGKIVGTWYQNDGPSGDFEFLVDGK